MPLENKQDRGAYTLPPIVVECKVVRRLVGEIVYQPPMPKRAVSYICNVELARGGDKTVRLVKSLESRIFCLYSVDSGNCVIKTTINKRSLSAADMFTLYHTYLNLPSSVLQPSTPIGQCTSFCPAYAVNRVPEWILRVLYLYTSVSLSWGRIRLINPLASMRCR